MFFKKKRKAILGSKKYKIERQAVRYRNPLRLKKGLFQFKLFRIINLILFIGIFACLYFFIFSDFYNITNIEVFGNQIISSDDILDITNDYLAKNKLLVFKNKNIFLFDRNDLKEKINEVIILQDLKVEKILPNTIRITLKEKDSALKWLTSNQEYLVDKEGLIIKRYYKFITPKIFSLIEIEKASAKKSDSNLLQIINLANQEINLGDRVLNPEDVEFILNLIPKLKEKDYSKIKTVSVPNNFPQYLIVEFEPGWLIHFNLADSIESQLNRLDALINQKIEKSNLPYLDYIDLRLGESVYYKMK